MHFFFFFDEIPIDCIIWHAHNNKAKKWLLMHIIVYYDLNSFLKIKNNWLYILFDAPEWSDSSCDKNVRRCSSVTNYGIEG